MRLIVGSLFMLSNTCELLYLASSWILWSGV